MSKDTINNYIHIIICTYLLIMSLQNCNYVHLTQVSRCKQHERHIISYYRHTVTNNVTIMTDYGLQNVQSSR